MIELLLREAPLPDGPEPVDVAVKNGRCEG